MKNLCAAFIFASAFAYLGGFFLVLLDHPPILNISPILQIIVFVFMCAFSMFAIQVDENKKPMLPMLNLLLAILWSAMSAFTFVGYVRWAPDGSAPYQLFMTVWDLLLAVAVLED